MSAVVAAKEAPPVPATKDAPPSPSKKEKGSEEKKKRRGGRANRSKKDKDKAKEADAEATKSSFDCSSAIAKVSESLWVSAVSGTRMECNYSVTVHALRVRRVKGVRHS